MSYLEAILLGFVQGVTEFLPISSAGHLTLIHEFLEVESTNALAFEGALHLATACAVIFYFWTDLWVLIQAVLRKLGRLPVNQKDLTVAYALVVGTIPAVVVAVVAESYLSELEYGSAFVAGALFLSALFLMYAEWKYFNRTYHEGVTVKPAAAVGFFQALALVPGFSRSGLTIGSGMLLGMSRYEASRFSLLLAIPITTSIGTQRLLELIQTNGNVSWLPVALGSLTAMVVSMLVIHFFLSFVRKNTLWPFIWYSVILSALLGYVGLVI